MGQRLTYDIDPNRRFLAKSVTFFYEISTCDLYLISGVTGVVRGTLSYDYKVVYKEENKNKSRSVSGTGNGVEDADGSSQMSAEFVYQNGSYQLRSVNPGNIWYKQLQ